MADITTALFKYVINYNLAYSVDNNQISFVPAKQNIMLTEIAVFPALNITVIEALASYPRGHDTHIAEATAAILNIAAEATLVKDEPVVKNIKATEPIIKK